MPFEVRTEADIATVMAEACKGGSTDDGRHFEELGDDRYRFEIPSFGITIELGRLRRDKHELWGELTVFSGPREQLKVGSALSIADFNVSSARERTARADLLARRISTLEWEGVIEEFCQRVVAADRSGQGAVDLRTLSKPTAEDALDLMGVSLLRRHPTIIFGDGGAAKSYLALYLVGQLAQRGMRVAIFDWELAGEDHRDRLERLFGPSMPKVIYARCARSLVNEADRLRRIVQEEQIDFAVYDSIAFACDGPPEAAEVAGRYFRSVREIGVGSLHIAHINKGQDADKKPFGSAFWHNGARVTWFARKAEDSTDTSQVTIGLYNRKANLGPLRPPISFRITFFEGRTTFERVEVADSADLAQHLSVKQRMFHALRRGPMECEQLAQEIESTVDTVKRTARRYRKLFTVLEGGQLALAETVDQ